jgi:chitinase
MARSLLLLIAFNLFVFSFLFAQKPVSVIAYYAGSPTQVDSFEIEKLTHIIFSFCHLKGNILNVSNARDTATIQKLVRLKSRNPNLKVILSLGGWGGCQTCSDVFSFRRNRKEFARSVKRISEFFGTDGIDLDWEYPAIEGYPAHKFQPEDKQHFTQLVKKLRRTLGPDYIVSFAAGGFKKYIDEAVDWKKVTKKVNMINLMSYDLVSGYDTKTGHHTALFSTSRQMESTDNSIQLLLKHKVPPNKIVIGAAFYARMWENVSDTGYGLYQQGIFKKGVSYRNFEKELSADSGFVYHWDTIANAPYLYNPAQKLFVTYDDKRSIEMKVKYVIDHQLNGIMFWQLGDDAFTDGLLEIIDRTRNRLIKK